MDNALRVMLQTYEGREFILSVIQTSRAFETYSLPEEHSQYLNGRKSVGLEIFNRVLTIDPKYFTIMYDEFLTREDHDRQRRANERTDSGDADGTTDSGAEFVPVFEPDAGGRA